MIVNALGPPPQYVHRRVPTRRACWSVRSAGRAQHAERQVAMGVDVVVAQGTEAGGHCGEISTMVLVPQIVDAVGDRVPVLAAGGIADGRQMAAAMALGAQGVWCGSIWLLTEEADMDPEVTENLLAADVARLRAVAVHDRQAGPPAAHRVDRGVGAARRPAAAADAAAGAPLRRGRRPLHPRALQGVRRQPRRADPRQRRQGDARPARSCSTWSRAGSTPWARSTPSWPTTDAPRGDPRPRLVRGWWPSSR